MQRRARLGNVLLLVLRLLLLQGRLMLLWEGQQLRWRLRWQVLQVQLLLQVGRELRLVNLLLQLLLQRLLLLLLRRLLLMLLLLLLLLLRVLLLLQGQEVGQLRRLEERVLLRLLLRGLLCL